jgi:hypothetical protein
MRTPCNMIITINPMQRLTSTGRKGYYLITRARTSLNRLSLALTVEFYTRQSSNNCPGYPRGRLLVVKHRQKLKGKKYLSRYTGDAPPPSWMWLWSFLVRFYQQKYFSSIQKLGSLCSECSSSSRRCTLGE